MSMENDDVANLPPGLLGWTYVEIFGAGVAAVVSALFLAKLYKRSQLRLPPGPPGWPVIGNLLNLTGGTPPHQILAKLADKYGPIIQLYLGVQPTVIVSSAEIAKAIFQTNDQDFASRPQIIFADACFNEDLAFEPYGDRFRMLRKIVAVELVNAKRIQQFKAVRKQVVLNALESIILEGREGLPSNLEDKLSEMTFNNMTQMMFNKTFYGKKTFGTAAESESKDFHHIMDMIAELGLGAAIGDVLPWLRRLDLDGYQTRAKQLRNQLDIFLTTIINEHRRPAATPRPEMEDIVDVLLQIQKDKSNKAEGFSDTQIKGLLADLLVGGTDTSTSSTFWAMTELVRHPKILKRAQQEIDAVVGKERLVEESDLDKLPYLRAIANESFRLHPIGTLLAPRLAAKDVKVAGYDIPRDTRVIANVYAIQRDPKVWENPLEFNPDRWSNTPIDHRGNYFSFLPFGVGKRICPGMNLGLLMVLSFMAQLIHSCEISLPKGMMPEDVDMQEVFGLATRLKNSPQMFFTPRLPQSVYIEAGMKL